MNLEPVLNFLHLKIHNPWICGLIAALIVLAVLGSIRFFASQVIHNLIRRLIMIFQTTPDERIVRATEQLTYRVLALLAIRLIADGFPTLGATARFIHGSVFILIAWYLLLGMFKVIDSFTFILRVRAPDFEPLIIRMAKLVAALVILMIAMKHFDYDIWHIMTALGVGTLAVGLAAQPTLANMIAGFTILVDRPFRPGDRIALATGEVGDVTQIGLRSTRIYTTDSNTLIVSNSELVGSRVINYSVPDQNLSQSVKFYVDPSYPVSEIKKNMKEVAEKANFIVPGSVSVYSTRMTDWALEISISFKAESFAKAGNAIDQVLDTVITEFHKRDYKFAIRTADPKVFGSSLGSQT